MLYVVYVELREREKFQYQNSRVLPEVGHLIFAIFLKGKIFLLKNISVNFFNFSELKNFNNSRKKNRMPARGKEREIYEPFVPQKFHKSHIYRTQLCLVPCIA